MKRLLSLVVLLCLLTASLSLAQNTGLPPFNSFSNAGGGIDTINLGNLNVHLSIPMRSLGAYGPQARTALVMDSLVYITSPPSLIWSPAPFSISNSTISQGAASAYFTGSGCSGVWTAQNARDQEGTMHPTAPLVLNGCNAKGSTVPGADGWTIVGTTDSNANGVFTAVSPTGEYSNGSQAVIYDPHGN